MCVLSWIIERRSRELETHTKPPATQAKNYFFVYSTSVRNATRNVMHTRQVFPSTRVNISTLPPCQVEVHINYVGVQFSFWNLLSYIFVQNGAKDSSEPQHIQMNILTNKKMRYWIKVVFIWIYKLWRFGMWSCSHESDLPKDTIIISSFSLLVCCSCNSNIY